MDYLANILLLRVSFGRSLFFDLGFTTAFDFVAGFDFVIESVFGSIFALTKQLSFQDLLFPQFYQKMS